MLFTAVLHVSLIRKILAAHKKVIGVFCFKRTRAQWIQCILKMMFKFIWSEMAETNTKRCQWFLTRNEALFTVGRIKSKKCFVKYWRRFTVWGIMFFPFSFCLRQKRMTDFVYQQSHYQNCSVVWMLNSFHLHKKLFQRTS